MSIEFWLRSYRFPRRRCRAPRGGGWPALSGGCAGPPSALSPPSAAPPRPDCRGTSGWTQPCTWTCRSGTGNAQTRPGCGSDPELKKYGLSTKLMFQLLLSPLVFSAIRYIAEPSQLNLSRRRRRPGNIWREIKCSWIGSLRLIEILNKLIMSLWFVIIFFISIQSLVQHRVLDLRRPTGLDCIFYLISSEPFVCKFTALEAQRYKYNKYLNVRQ